MIKSVWQERVSGGSVSSQLPQDLIDKALPNLEKKNCKSYKNLKLLTGLEYLKTYRTKANELQIVKVNKGPERSAIQPKYIPKRDNNWIRIQVTYDETTHINEQTISKVPIKYNSISPGYVTKEIIDTPDAVVTKCKQQPQIDYWRKSVQDFLREDWITEDDQSYESRFSFINGQTIKGDNYSQSQSQNMGCSISVHHHGKRSIAPIEDFLERDNDEQIKKSIDPGPNDFLQKTVFTTKTASEYPNIFLSRFKPVPHVSSSIEWDNILHRRNDSIPKNYDLQNLKQMPKSSKNNTHSVRVAMKTLKSQTSPITNNNVGRTKLFGKYLRNISGSVQNISKLGKNESDFRSASENNLSKLSKHKLNKNSKKYSSTFEVDYCPSVLFNRKQMANRKHEELSYEKRINFKKLKNFFTVNLPKRHKAMTENSKIQDIDGGFFEKFGSLLKQKTQLEEKNLTVPLAALSEEDELPEEEKLAAIKELEQDSGTETLNETDSEPEDIHRKHESFIEGAVGMNIDELYEEILFEILHNLGCEESPEVCQSALFEYVQEAFKISNETHEEILQSASNKEPPEVRLNVEIIKAENLMSKDSNGFSDPFVTLYLESNMTHRYNTSVKSATLNPLWEEHFSLPIPENPNNEILVIEVWDFDAAETVGEKMNKIFEVKGVKGLRKLMKEIAVTASSGKHDNELIGRTTIPLKTIPASGIQVWYSLEKGSKVRSRGSVLIRLNFSAEKNNRVAAQEHRHLLKILLMHELETSKVAQFWWHGKFSSQGQAILTQHAAQSGLNQIDCALAQWSVFTNIHKDHSLSFGLFNDILDKIIPTIQLLQSENEEMKLFWESTKKLLPSCFSVIRKLRKKTTSDKNSIKMLNEVLDIISKISFLEPPEGTDLFPKQIFGWISRDDDNNGSPNWNIRGALNDAVISGTRDWYEHINEDNEEAKYSEDTQLQNLIKLIQLVRSDLQRAIEYYDKYFQQKMHFNYAQTLYRFYEAKLAEQSKQIVQDVCANIKLLPMVEDRIVSLPNIEEINMGTTLFELYLVLKRFATLGTALCPGEDDLAIFQYHLWFTRGVTHWLDISVYKALVRIEKAIDLDKLTPVDDTVKYSSSAVDTLAIFYQIKIFWQQLGWPDIEGAYMFVGKIVDDICRCCVFYADRMSVRVEELNLSENEQRFQVTQEWCLAINNIDYIRQSLSPFIKELGVDDIITKLAEFRSSLEAERCSQTLKNVIENAIDTERNKILELIEIVGRKMAPAMRRFLIEGAEILHEDSNSMERLMIYLEDSLQILHNELNELNFERTLDAIWCELSTILYELVQTNLDKRRPPSFFANLRKTLRVMTSSFKLKQNTMHTSSDKETLDQIERLLELHGYETAELIHQYYLERLEEQNEMKDTPYGQLTVRCYFNDKSLELEIMNARNLIPMDSDGSCDSFVKIHFMPPDKFLGTSSPKTSSQSKTLFPLYDERFTINLTPEQLSMKNALIVFSVKDKDLFGMSNQYLAECYLSFDQAAKSNNEQLHLPLSRPSYKDTNCIRALEYRQGDKQAREFIKKLKQKSH